MHTKLSAVVHTCQTTKHFHLIFKDKRVLLRQDRTKSVGLPNETHAEAMVEMTVRQQMGYRCQFVVTNIVTNSLFF